MIKRIIFVLMSTLMLLFSPNYAHMETASISELFPFQYEGKWGFVSEQGEEIIPPTWEYAEPFINNVAIIGIKETDESFSYGLINLQGDYILSPQYKIIEEEFSLLISTNTEPEKWGYYDKQTGFYCEPQYDAIIDSSSDILYPIAVEKNGKWGFVNRNTGIVVIPCVYDDIIAPFNNGFALMCMTLEEPSEDLNLYDQYILLNPKGEEVTFERQTMPVYNSSSNGTVVIMKRLDADGDINYASNFENVYLYGLANTHGDTILSPTYRYIGEFNNGEASICTVDGKWGTIDENGDIIIPPEYKTEDDLVLSGYKP